MERPGAHPTAPEEPDHLCALDKGRNKSNYSIIHSAGMNTHRKKLSCLLLIAHPPALTLSLPANICHLGLLG